MVGRRPVCTDSGSLHNDNATTLLLALFMTDILEINDNLTARAHFCQGRIAFSLSISPTTHGSANNLAPPWRPFRA